VFLLFATDPSSHSTEVKIGEGMKGFIVAVTLGVCAAFVQAVHYQVATGLQGASGAIYAPDSLIVQPGDTIEFILIGVVLIDREN